MHQQKVERKIYTGEQSPSNAWLSYDLANSDTRIDIPVHL